MMQINNKFTNINTGGGYKQVYFEISGLCNAKCKYCVTGIENQNKAPVGAFVDIVKFQEALLHLRKSNIIEKNTNIALYNWGEPFMHPKFAEIISFLAEKDFKFSISTNASIPLIDFSNKNVMKNLTHITFSCCGFSQESYDKIHQFKFEVIRKNIIQIIDKARKYGFRGSAIINYHIYQFNMGEEYEIARQFCLDNTIGFAPSYATINDFERGQAYLNDNISKKELREIGKDLCLFYLDDLLKSCPEDYICPQFEYLNIDETLEVLTCCGPKDEKHGDIRTLNIDSLKKLLRKAEKCKECQRLKQHYWLHNVPRYRERKLTIKYILDKVKNKIFN